MRDLCVSCLMDILFIEGREPEHPEARFLRLDTPHPEVYNES